VARLGLLLLAKQSKTDPLFLLNLYVVGLVDFLYVVEIQTGPIFWLVMQA
jgi:hypothetical protein